VTVKDAAGGTIAKAGMTLGDDGVWLIKGLPESTDLSAVGLTFTLPSGASISPSNGSLHDFSEGKTVTYRVTSGGSTLYYEVGLRRTGDPDSMDDYYPESSTNITKGVVTVLGKDGQTIVTIVSSLMELQPDGTWQITVPDSADISKAALRFSLPDDGALVIPDENTFLDFSGGKIMKYFVISANWDNFRVYQIRLIGGLDNPADSSDDEGAEGSTDITNGLVIVSDDEGKLIAEVPMQKAGSLWVITVPTDTDLSRRVALTFPLPSPNTTVLPSNGSLQDFSDGKTVLYHVISANGQNVDGYEVQLKVAVPVSEGTLVKEDIATWSFTESARDSGVAFMVEAPLADGVQIASIDAVQKVELGGDYSNVQFVATNSQQQFLAPVLSIAGTAYTQAELEKLDISRVEWTLTDGSKWYQDLRNVTYAALTDGTKAGESGGGGDDSGCDLTAWPFLAILCAAGLMFSRKKRS
jgi:hypothetical protein